MLRGGNGRASESCILTSSQPEDASVAVVEDDDGAREALAFQLSTAGYQTVSFPSAVDFLANNQRNFDCIVADIFLPMVNGLELQEQLIDSGNLVPIVFITGRGDLAIGVQAMRRGAVDVLEKPVEDQAILGAIARAVRQARADRASHVRHTELAARFNSLPVRQREVFTLITAGLLNKQVAAELGISERTVKVHRERLRRRMGADSLAELSRIAEILQIHSLPSYPARRARGSVNLTVVPPSGFSLNNNLPP